MHLAGASCAISLFIGFDGWPSGERESILTGSSRGCQLKRRALSSRLISSAWGRPMGLEHSSRVAEVGEAKTAEPE